VKPLARGRGFRDNSAIKGQFVVDLSKEMAGAATRRQAGTLGALVTAMRPHHWAKNLLVFLPVAMAHQLHNPFVMWPAVLVFAAFCMVASATYLINDLRDIEADRKHPTKRFRPLAAGLISPGHVYVLAPLLVVGAFALAFLTARPWHFIGALAAYVALAQFYVFFLKRKLLVDVLALAALHILRIVAGNMATGIEPSSWLLAFAMFLFFSLALLKRYSELREAGDAVGLRGVGRGYQAGDLETLSQLGIGSALITVVVVALYVNSPQVKELYRTPELIWLVCPVVLYVLARLWVLARRGHVPDDPLMFLAFDWRSQLMAGLTVAIVLAAKLF
jgi:4-hydroxybenzoate polyprenyltransferase